ncbi:MAG: hypothetical protein HRT47_03415 [Candidatus Caenarcaniphilales bacterium]|nr:hypothetical protein [Candidatus Caenarcaniphilales bacterium]
MLGFITKPFQSVIGLFGKKNTEPPPQKSNSIAPRTSRAQAKKMSESVKSSSPLPIGKSDFGEVFNYMKSIQEEFSKKFSKIPSPIRNIAQRMTDLDENQARQAGVSTNDLNAIKNKFSEDIGPMDLLSFQKPLTKIIKYYSKQFGINTAQLQAA